MIAAGRRQRGRKKGSIEANQGQHERLHGASFPQTARSGDRYYPTPSQRCRHSPTGKMGPLALRSGTLGHQAKRQLSPATAWGCLARKQPKQLSSQCPKRSFRHRLARVHHDVPAAGNRRLVQPEDLAHSTLQSIAKNSSANASRHRDAQSRLAQTIRSEEHGAQRSVSALPFVIDEPKLTTAQQSSLLGKRLPQPGFHGMSRFRCLKRRRRSTFRPPGVLMRMRNPCVLARRRRLG